MTYRNKGSVVWKVLISLALLIVLLALVAEFGVRYAVTNQLKSQVAESTGASTSDVHVGLSPSPMLLALATKKLKDLDVDTPSTLKVTPGNPPTIEGSPESRVSMTDLDFSDQQHPVAGTMQVETRLPEDFMLAQVQASMAEQQKSAGSDPASQFVSNLVRVTSINMDRAGGDIEVVFTDGAAKLKLQPRAEGGKLKFEASDAQLLGFKLPSQATDAITRSLEKQSSDVSGPLEVKDVLVEDDSLMLVFSGENVPVRELDQLSQVEGTRKV